MPVPQPRTPAHLLSVSLDLPLPGTSHKRNPIFVRLYLAPFTTFSRFVHIVTVAKISFLSLAEFYHILFTHSFIGRHLGHLHLGLL